MSKKPRSLSLPDLFDDIDFSTRSAYDKKGFPFVNDFQVLNKRPNIAYNHSRFNVASAVARFFLDNGVHLQDTIPFGQLLLKSLDALDKGFDPPCILFKTIFQFARLEGLPVKQDWLDCLDSTEKEIAISKLNAKLSDQEPDEVLIIDLVNSLCEWLRRETEIKC